MELWNLARLVANYNVRVRYNELSREIEVSVANSVRDGELSRNTNLALIEDLCRINKYPYTQAAGNIKALLSATPITPPWIGLIKALGTGEPRIGELFDCRSRS